MEPCHLRAYHRPGLGRRSHSRAFTAPRSPHRLNLLLRPSAGRRRYSMSATSERSHKIVLPPPQTKEFFDRVLVLEGECRQELESSVQSLGEISLLLSKTNSEVEKLANRELQMSNRVREM